MKTEQKTKVRDFETSRTKKSLKYQNILVPFFVVLFILTQKCLAAEKVDVVINEIYATGKDNWIELFNGSDEDIDLSLADARLYKSLTSSPSLLMRIGNSSDGNYPGGSIIKARSFYLIVRDDASESLRAIADAICTKDSFTWNGEKYTFYLGDGAISNANDQDIIDMLGFGDVANYEGSFASPIPDGKSIGRINGKDTNDNGADFMIQKPSPGKENEEWIEGVELPDPVSEPIVKNKTYMDNIQITELFPNPFQSQYEEYIELYNNSFENVDLMDWMLRDASKSGKYVFPSSAIIKAKEYIAVFKNDFKFALNNSGRESVTLFDPNGKEVAKAQYDGSKRNVSYNFDGARWRWSKFLTPGKENILNNEPYGKVNVDDDIYKKVYAEFSVSTGDADGDKVKITWDFGDGHKSYLAKTRHKYEKTGTFNGSVKLSDGSEDVIKAFVVEVKKYPHPKVRIIAINANPKGKDSVFENITIENKSKEKINLDGWSIATGAKKLINHPITEKFVIKKKEIKEITREFSKFSLNNKKGKIELRYPDGEVADKIKYDHGKVSIDEDEKYIKTKNGWSWAAVPKPITQNLKPEIQKTELEIKVKAEIAGVETIKREYSFVMLEKNISIGKMEFKNSDSRVLGAETVREIDGQYFLVNQGKEQQHYIVLFLKKGYFTLNSKINYLLTYIFS